MNVTKDIDAACIGTRLLNIQPITLKVSEIQNTFLCIAFNRRGTGWVLIACLLSLMT